MPGDGNAVRLTLLKLRSADQTAAIRHAVGDLKRERRKCQVYRHSLLRWQEARWYNARHLAEGYLRALLTGGLWKVGWHNVGFEISINLRLKV